MGENVGVGAESEKLEVAPDRTEKKVSLSLAT